MNNAPVRFVDDITMTIVGLLSNIAPILSPLPTAYLVYARTVQRLAWPAWVGLAAAIVVESLGLVVALTALQLYSYNRSKLAGEPRAPVRLAYLLVGVYLVSAEILTVILDVAPRWGALDAPGRIVALSQALFPILTLAGLLTLAVRFDHAQRLAGNAAGKAERKAEAAIRRTERSAPRVTETEPAAIPAAPRRNRAAFLAEYPGMAAMPAVEIAELAGITSRAARDWKKWAGNGHGPGPLGRDGGKR